jgi:hypothetical protein
MPTSDKLSARAITEARGGKTLADVVEFGLEDINKIHEQGLLLDKAPPEAAAYPADLKGSYWAANNLILLRRRLEHRTRLKRTKNRNSLTTSAIRAGKDG